MSSLLKEDGQRLLLFPAGPHRLHRAGLHENRAASLAHPMYYILYHSYYYPPSLVEIEHSCIGSRTIDLFGSMEFKDVRIRFIRKHTQRSLAFPILIITLGFRLVYASESSTF